MRFPLAIAASVLGAYALSLYLTIPANPELGFWSWVMKRRDHEIAQARKEQPGTPIIFFTGGSSTAFSIDPYIIEQATGLPAFNLGLPVSAGGPYLLHQAFKRTHPGDIMVVCLEADALAYGTDANASPLSFSLSLLDHDPVGAAGGTTFDRKLNAREALNLPRPGARYLTTLAARLAIGKDYRYKPTDIRYHGRIETAVKNPSNEPLGTVVERRLHPAGATLLRKLSAAAEERGITLFYSMPWRWTLPGYSEAWRISNQSLLADINEIIPVLDDDTRGVETRREFFSDSVQHLTAAGSAARTHALAPILRAALAK
jgi:hypothetical protein